MPSTRHHAEWLSLVEVSGPFLTMPVLEKVFPQGLEAHDPEHVRNLRLACDEWETNQTGHRPNPAIHRAWIDFVLKETLGLPEEVIVMGQAVPQTLRADVFEHGETLRPDVVVRNPRDGAKPETPRLLVQVYAGGQDLEKPVAGRHWKASPGTRMMELLHATDIRIGLVTNGEHWMLVDAPRGGTTGFASWYATLWLEEPLTLRAFRSLLGVRRFFSVQDDETLEAMLRDSADYQNEVTDQLGLQVRRAVEVLIQSLDRADQDHGGELLAGVPETVLYEASLTVMMRLVFLFCAEERGLLLLGDPLYDENYSVSTLVSPPKSKSETTSRTHLEAVADQHGEEVLERRFDAWVRLLATFRAVYGGVQHDRMKLPAYAGNLFHPDRFPFLEDRTPAQSWRTTPARPLPINNRTVLHLLRSLQYLEMQGEARRLSFRALDIEQIGHVYEGLLDHTAKRAAEPMLGLLGAKGHEPEVALAELERRAVASREASAPGVSQASAPGVSPDLLKFLHEETGRTEKSLKRALETPLDGDDARKLKAVCGTDDKLFARVRPFSGLLRNDSFNRPVVIRQGSVFVTAGTDRRSSGTHYTPRSLTEPIVQYTLEPLVYVGPAEGKPKDEWTLRPARELLDLKVCDMACGSGAFLVQACRYLSERLVEAWEDAESRLSLRESASFRGAKGDHTGSPQLTPYGDASTGAPHELLIPSDPDERLVYARRIVAQRCLYGVDKNPLAAEMAKLSLWLLTLARDKPFTFLDHAIRCGDSLVGIKSLDQIKHFNLDPDKAARGLFSGPILELVDEAVELRKQLESLPVNTADDVQTKEQLLAQAEEKTARLRFAADFLISVEFTPTDSAGDKEDLHNLRAIEAGHFVREGTLGEFREAARNALNGQTTFHWPLEFPEVMIDRGGFDAFVGNPPFKGGAALATLFGASWRDFVVTHVGSDVRTNRGQFDLCVFFFLRACQLRNCTGIVSGIATNSFAQGDSKIIGLSRLYALGHEVIRALNDVQWPGSASMHVCLTWIAQSPWLGDHWLDGNKVDAISDALSDAPEMSKYFVLKENDGIAFRGAMPYGEGFFIEQAEAMSLLDANESHCAALMPYLIGDDVNSHPRQSPSRFIINFHDWPLTGGPQGRSATDYPSLLKIVEERVKPQRLALPSNNSTAKHRQKVWWQFSNRADDLLAALHTKRRALAISRTTAHLAFAFVPTHNIVHSERLVVVADDSWEMFGVLQSSVHEAWACRPGMMTHETRKTYFVKETFCTFPRPFQCHELPNCARAYYVHRAETMEKLLQGLTGVYNRFHDPAETFADIQNFRNLHVEMDKAVAAAYGWENLDLGHGFHETKQGVRFTISEPARREVLARLLKLNHERYAEEVAQGLHDKKSGKRGQARKTTRKTAPRPNELKLFSETIDHSQEAAPSPYGSAAVMTAPPTPAPDDTWYFAYGSNLSRGRKEERTGLIRSARPARLAGYRLAFNKRGRNGEVYANIVPQPGGVVWGVIYLCNPAAMAELDRREGVLDGHYSRSRVRTTTAGGESVEADTYIAGPAHVTAESHPGDEYLHLILTGAAEHSLPADYIASIRTLARPDRSSGAEQEGESESPHRVRETDDAASRPTPIEEVETDEIMAAFRQAARGRGLMERDELLKDVSLLLGYQRLGSKVEETLRGQLRAAIRRRIIEADGANLVRGATVTLADYTLEELRETFRSVMQPSRRYEREDVLYALARHLGFSRVTDTTRETIKSALNSAIRQGLLGYEGSVIWREE